MSALGYYVPGDRHQIDIQFLPRLDGYIWVFPRCGHLSVGICGKGETAAALRVRLERYMDEQGISREGATFYSHLLPCLDTPAWKRNRVAGDGWLAVGDAAGLVDPITGEGLVLRDALGRPGNAGDPGRKSPKLRERLTGRHCGAILWGIWNSVRAWRTGSSTERFLWGAVTSRMVQFTRLSPKFRDVMQDLFAGTQPYVGLKKRLFRNLNGSLIEIICNLGFGRLIPRRDAA